MLNLAKDIRRLTENRVVQAERRQPFIEASLARGLATALQLPTSPLQEGAFLSHFIDRHAVTVKAALGQINEVFVINVKETSDMVLKFYRLRYNFVFEPNEKMVMDVFDTLASNDADLIPKRIIDIMQEAKTDPEFKREMTRMMSDIMKEIIQQMAPEQNPDENSNGVVLAG